MKLNSILTESTLGDLFTFKIHPASLKQIKYKDLIKLLEVDYVIQDAGHFETVVTLNEEHKTAKNYTFTVNVKLNDEAAAQGFGYLEEYEWTDDEDHGLSFNVIVYYSYSEGLFKAEYSGDGIKRLSPAELEKLF